ncbi:MULTISPECIES: hypothetical protein [unclassified Herbaspirillum]|uniref:hypothetical protein n=1 Tax=unclassified Herbaspirillum TaxID=2624150 RepID=UPI000E2F6C6E|nr:MULTISPECIES: hypothetical protein [unclassified Herbaspirillum]RFB73224.1 hypothetical protein DZB54_02675 [Herbaspirillum sp. 3R-3a1]TFI10965.1 hypothetical protein E4P32_05490 [Herbaspirillum sp. 3R11]TFI16872.1 hypothetical protein E4P31_05490 [Herbaspirillum sp. 3R-11]TFI30519.1 hypothetical protein E4P30_03705 [Herbaspirillum sp. 3C11]
MRCLSLMLLLVFSWGVGATTLERMSGESIDAFLVRTAPRNRQPVQKPVVTDALGFSAPVLLVAYAATSNDSPDPSPGVQLFLFVPKQSDSYERVLIDTYEPEGADASIESIFFSSIDKTSDKKLFVIVSWEQNHAIVKGTLYQTFIYSLTPKSADAKPQYLQALSDKLSGGCDCWRADEPASKARYKNAAQVRAGLLKIK